MSDIREECGVFGVYSDTSCDLAVVASVLSSNFDFPIPPDVCFAGEVGLSGEIRPVGQTERRVAEAARLGFKRIYISSFTRLAAQPASPASGQTGSSETPLIDIVRVADIAALVRKLFK